ncbi:transporter [Paludisphaera mucosa]|uniref:Transporter n=1 Tax=Paludisphaera mucosa TaxID=3030827 RepID=A0ABT6F4K7_9BACT|nr:transporter [Paludisphaera mucosa]MDG3002510.1 hypothetical protein [Paludisphaera mucosa]
MLRTQPVGGGWPRARRLALAAAALALCAQAAGQGAAPPTAPGADYASLATEFDPGPGSEEPEFFAGRGDAPEAPRIETSLLGAAVDSIFGDAYAPGRWHPLPLRTFFSEGWNEAWAGAPAGKNGTSPRHGWLGAFQGVFYRLWFVEFGYAHGVDVPRGSQRYTGDYTLFLPLNRRFEVMIQAPFLMANGTVDPLRGYASGVGDLRFAPKLMLSESEGLSQTLSMLIRVPTGSTTLGEGIASLDPRYEFWSNPFGSWVVRGGGGPSIPLNPHHAAATTTLIGDAAIGRFFRPHDVPFGDLVVYAACNYKVPLRGDVTSTYVGVGPGTRFHVGRNYFLLHYWEFAVAGAHPQDYTVQSALLKIF